MVNLTGRNARVAVGPGRNAGFGHGETGEPLVARWLFGRTESAWIWLILRLYPGWQWLAAGSGKMGDPKGADGSSLTGFARRALNKASGAHPDVQGRYADFLQRAVVPHAALWAHLVAWGEALVGVALILGLLTGIAAFCGSFMNVNYPLAGTVSTRARHPAGARLARCRLVGA